MPYIGNIHRGALDIATTVPGTASELNYRITREIDRWMRNKGLRYQTINTVIGVLECAKLELYRRIAAPYEDTKLVENGDVYTCNKSAPKG